MGDPLSTQREQYRKSLACPEPDPPSIPIPRWRGSASASALLSRLSSRKERCWMEKGSSREVETRLEDR